MIQIWIEMMAKGDLITRKANCLAANSGGHKCARRLRLHVWTFYQTHDAHMRLLIPWHTTSPPLTATTTHTSQDANVVHEAKQSEKSKTTFRRTQKNAIHAINWGE